MADQFLDPLFCLTGEARFRRVVDEGVIVLQAAAEVIVVDEVGVTVLELLNEPVSIDHLINTLLERYETDRDQLAADIPVYLNELEQAGVVRRVIP